MLNLSLFSIFHVTIVPITHNKTQPFYTHFLSSFLLSIPIYSYHHIIPIIFISFSFSLSQPPTPFTQSITRPRFANSQTTLALGRTLLLPPIWPFIFWILQSHGFYYKPLLTLSSYLLESTSSKFDPHRTAHLEGALLNDLMLCCSYP